jgi:hypothetical protein
VAGSSKRLASRFYQLKTGHCPTSQYLRWDGLQVLVVPVQDTDTGAHLQSCPRWKAQQKILWAKVRKEAGRGKDRFKIQDHLADARCSRAVLDFLSITDVGRRAPPGRRRE